ncbi:hypothetical protein [Vibrio parahaemolyticus]|uniref:hypothetical protein n=1 Tax=Vibrio parahaemolyticus TaxID=670 RepID=UPI001122BCDD|nr:hypothetical protein [Vibrio parahaemolyticus]TOG95094.1 hypothetical protein CGI92_14140 [Vibrio parahaemolyticus]
MLAFLKKWRKAYLEDKGDRLHDQVEAERNALCQQSITIEQSAQTLRQSTISWGKAFQDAHNECTRYEEEQAYYR